MEEEQQRRTVDLLASCLGLAVLSPLLVIIALLIKLESPGPVLFRQERVGKGAKRFDILKFRSMQSRPAAGGYLEDGSDLASFRFRPRGRKTSIGQALRACSLDELPNLLNVVKGELHLVGPRPDEPELVAKYEPAWHERHEVLPGITGLAQIKGRTDLTYREMMAYDRRYVAKRSLTLDTAIMLRTLEVVFGRKGAR